MTVSGALDPPKRMSASIPENRALPVMDSRPLEPDTGTEAPFMGEVLFRTGGAVVRTC